MYASITTVCFYVSVFIWVWMLSLGVFTLLTTEWINQSNPSADQCDLIVSELSLILLSVQYVVNMSYAFGLGGHFFLLLCAHVWDAGFPERLLNRLAVVGKQKNVPEQCMLISLLHLFLLLRLLLGLPLLPFRPSFVSGHLLSFLSSPSVLSLPCQQHLIISILSSTSMFHPSTSINLLFTLYSLLPLVSPILFSYLSKSGSVI